MLLIELENNFQYLLPVLQTLPSHFESTALLGGRSFHFFADPIEIETKVNLLLTIRDKANIEAKPLLVWEPKAGILYFCKLERVLSGGSESQHVHT